MSAQEEAQSRFDQDPLGSIIGLITRLEVNIAALQSMLVEKGVLTPEEVTLRHTRIFAERAEAIYAGNRAWLTSPDGTGPQGAPQQLARRLGEATSEAIRRSTSRRKRATSH